MPDEEYSLEYMQIKNSLQGLSVSKPPKTKEIKWSGMNVWFVTQDAQDFLHVKPVHVAVRVRKPWM